MHRSDWVHAFSLTVLLLVLQGAGPPVEIDQHPPNRPSSTARLDIADDWITLFDGDNLKNWSGFPNTDASDAWTITSNGLLHCTGADGPDLATRKTFGDFVLELEWKISPGGNSGIFYRINSEDIHTGPEMQVIDHHGYDHALDSTQMAGAVYALYPPQQDAAHEQGQWNRARIVVKGSQVEHWLNGVQVAKFEFGSPDWKKRVAQSKFADNTDYGTYSRGHIVLQNHGDPVWYRNIRIKPLR